MNTKSTTTSVSVRFLTPEVGSICDFSVSYHRTKTHCHPSRNRQSHRINSGKTGRYLLPGAQWVDTPSPAPSCQEAMMICFGIVGDEEMCFIFCNHSARVVVVFVHWTTQKNNQKNKANRLIPTASCLWRQEDVTVAILVLSTRVWMSAL